MKKQSEEKKEPKSKASPKILEFNSSYGHREILFKVESDIELTEDDAKELQLVRGRKHPAGYGFYKFSCKKNGKTFISSWECLASCD